MKVKLTIAAIVMGAVFLGASAETEGWEGDLGKVGLKAKADSEVVITFVSMDFDGNGRANITDVQGMIDWLYLGGEPAVCPAAMDFDDNGQINVTDLMGMMEWLYLGGESPFYPDTVVVASCDGVDV